MVGSPHAYGFRAYVSASVVDLELPAFPYRKVHGTQDSRLGVDADLLKVLPCYHFSRNNDLRQKGNGSDHRRQKQGYLGGVPLSKLDLLLYLGLLFRTKRDFYDLRLGDRGTLPVQEKVQMVHLLVGADDRYKTVLCTGVSCDTAADRKEDLQNIHQAGDRTQRNDSSKAVLLRRAGI